MKTLIIKKYTLCTKYSASRNLKNNNDNKLAMVSTVNNIESYNIVLYKYSLQLSVNSKLQEHPNNITKLQHDINFHFIY